MTYCCGAMAREGLVMIADARASARLDNISTFRKLHIFEKPGERAVMLATAGNLSVTQGVVNFIADGSMNPEAAEPKNIMTATDMLHAAPATIPAPPNRGREP